MHPDERQPHRPGTAPPGAQQPGYGYSSSSPVPLAPDMSGPGQYDSQSPAGGRYPAQYNPAVPFTPQQSYGPPPEWSSTRGSLKPKSSSAFKLLDQTLHTVNKVGGYAVPSLSNALNDLRGRLSQPQTPGQAPPSQYGAPQTPGSGYAPGPYHPQDYTPVPYGQHPPALPPRPASQTGYGPNQPPSLPPRMSSQGPWPPGYQGNPPQAQGVMGPPQGMQYPQPQQAQPTGPHYGPPQLQQPQHSGGSYTPPRPQQSQPTGGSYGLPQPQYVDTPAPGTPAATQPQMHHPQPHHPQQPQHQQQSPPPTSQHGPPQPQYATGQPTGPPGGPTPPPTQQPPVTTTGYGPPHPQYVASPPPQSVSPAVSQQSPQPQQPQPTGWVPPQPTPWPPPQPQYAHVPAPYSGAPSPGFGSPAPTFTGPNQFGAFPPQQPQYTNIVSPVTATPMQNALWSPATSNHQSPPPPPYSPFMAPQQSTVQELPSQPISEKPKQDTQPLTPNAAPGVFVAELDSTAPAKPPSPPSFIQELPGESAVPKPKEKPVPAGPQPGPPPGFPRNLPSLRLEGPGNSILAVCRQGRVDNFSTWYLANSAPGFTVCSRCYTDHIARSRHTGMFDSFTGSASPDGSFVPGHLCNFSSHTVQAHIWPKVLEFHSTAPLASYTVRRGGVRNCKDKLDRRSSGWFAPIASAQKPDFVVCEGCFLDNLSAGPFASQFTAIDESAPVPEHEQCIFRSSAYVARTVAAHEKEENWPLLLESVKKRLALPTCLGQPVPGDKWYTTKSPIPGFTMCEACYYDNIAASKFEDSIVPLPAESPGTPRVCNMLSTNGVPVILAMDAAREFSNFDIFFDVASKCIKTPPCGHPQSIYLTLANSSSAGQPFTVCALHAQAYLSPFNVTPHLLPFQPPAPAQGQAPRNCCALSRTSQHTMTYLSASQTSSDLGLLLPLHTAIAKLSLLPPCPKNVPIANALWYGWPDSPICPSCYEAVCVGTALAGIGHLPTPHASTISQPTPCVLYSARMRALFAHMSKKGDVEGFREQVQKRQRAWMELEAVRGQRGATASQGAGSAGGAMAGSAGPMEQMMKGLNLSLGGMGQKASSVRSLPSQTTGAKSLRGPGPAMKSQSPVDDGELAELEKMWAEFE
ncbi:uncharacterized protein MKZ38_003941 [Zalerion maritima]|uniref:Uncharacterized protein n=1 Tax=Zalerion maritima TaxID=339359 RepID=A0AAD5RM76_9PEZI|nr:uncharacterized protein MKZ38_003941 [Zalerion maritima]